MSGKHNCFLLSMWRICLYPEDCDALGRNSWKIEDTLAKKKKNSTKRKGILVYSIDKNIQLV